jgi:hypothetical protein
MFKHIKYALLNWLLDDICRRSKCDDCTCSCQVTLHLIGEDFVAKGCEHQDVRYQARKVWRIE